ncbi:MAG: WS/DGAT/MGAT family O-acyltransferase [Pseudomonadales bacterium]
MITSLKAGDSMLLYTETEFQYQHMVGILILDPSTAPHGFDVDVLKKVSESMVDDAPAYRLKLVDSPLTLDVPMLAEDPDFKLRNHMFHVAVPAPGTQEQLTEVIADIVSRPLSRSRPMWENWILSGLEGGRIAMVSKTHHCLQDGVGGAEVMARMFDLEPDPPPKSGDARSIKKPKTSAPSALKILHEAYKAGRERPSLLSTANKSVRTLVKRRKAHKNVADVDLLPPDMSKAPRLFFNGQLSAFRSVGLGSLSLPEIKRLKNAYGITLNDAILAVVAIGLRHYLEDHDDLPTEALACSIPVSLTLNKTADREEQEGNNQVSLMNTKLPIQITDPAELAQTINACSTAAKELFAQSGDEISRSIVASLPPRLAATGLGILSGAMMARNPIGNLGVSNVPGPPFPLYMRGAKVVANYPMGPVPNGVGLGITMMSYVDRIDFTVQGCREKIPDIQRLAKLLEAAVTELAESAPRESEAKTIKKRAVKKKPKATKNVGAKTKKASTSPRKAVPKPKTSAKKQPVSKPRAAKKAKAASKTAAKTKPKTTSRAKAGKTRKAKPKVKR